MQRSPSSDDTKYHKDDGQEGKVEGSERRVKVDEEEKQFQWQGEEAPMPSACVRMETVISDDSNQNGADMTRQEIDQQGLSKKYKS